MIRVITILIFLINWSCGVAQYNMVLIYQPPAAGGGFNADYQAVIDYANAQTYSLPSTNNQTCQNAFIQDCIDDGIWSILGEGFFMFLGSNNSDFAQINWADPGSTVPVISPGGTTAPTYSNADGYSSGSTTGYLATNWNPTDDCVSCSENDIAYGIMTESLVGPNFNQPRLLGANDGTTYTRIYFNKIGSNPIRLHSDLNTAAAQFFEAFEAAGLYVLTKVDAFQYTATINGVDIDTNGPPTQGELATDVYFMNANDNGSPETGMNNGGNVHFVFIGTKLTTAQVADLKTNYDTYASCID